MKRIKYNLFVPLLVLVFLGSCKKEYLDDKPYSSVLLVDAIKTESDLAGATTGMYTSLRNTDLYGRTLPVKGDLMADNTFVFTANSGPYTTLNSYIFTTSDAYALGIWTNAYVAIKYANTIIAASASITTSQSAGTTPAIASSRSSQCGFQAPLVVAGRIFQATGKAQLR